MFSTKDWVPGGTFAQWISGDVPPPGSAPGADWVNFTGISLPSEKPVTVRVIAGAAGRAAGWPPGAGACARAATASRDNPDAIAKTVRCIVSPLAAIRAAQDTRGAAAVSRKSSLAPERDHRV